jgi:hypothetical protein
MLNVCQVDVCVIFKQLVIQRNKFTISLGLNTLHSLVFIDIYRDVLYLKLLMLCYYRDMRSTKIVGLSE